MTAAPIVTLLPKSAGMQLPVASLPHDLAQLDEEVLARGALSDLADLQRAGLRVVWPQLDPLATRTPEPTLGGCEAGMTAFLADQRRRTKTAEASQRKVPDLGGPVPSRDAQLGTGILAGTGTDSCSSSEDSTLADQLELRACGLPVKFTECSPGFLSRARSSRSREQG